MAILDRCRILARSKLMTNVLPVPPGCIEKQYSTSLPFDSVQYGVVSSSLISYQECFVRQHILIECIHVVGCFSEHFSAKSIVEISSWKGRPIFLRSLPAIANDLSSRIINASLKISGVQSRVIPGFCRWAWRRISSVRCSLYVSHSCPGFDGPQVISKRTNRFLSFAGD